MKKYGERLKAARESANMSQAELARRARAAGQNAPSPQTVQYLEDPQKNAEGSQYTASFAFACGVDAVWLETGQGEMRRSNVMREPEASYTVADNPRELVEAIEDLRPELRIAIRRILGALRGGVRISLQGRRIELQPGSTTRRSARNRSRA